MDIVDVTVWDEEVSILDGEKLNPVICGSVVSDDEEVNEILVCLELLVEERLALSSRITVEARVVSVVSDVVDEVSSPSFFEQEENSSAMLTIKTNQE